MQIPGTTRKYFEYKLINRDFVTRRIINSNYLLAFNLMVILVPVKGEGRLK